MFLLKRADLLKGSTQAAIDIFCQIKLFNEENMLKVYQHFEVFCSGFVGFFYNIEREA